MAVTVKHLKFIVNNTWTILLSTKTSVHGCECWCLSLLLHTLWNSHGDAFVRTLFSMNGAGFSAHPLFLDCLTFGMTFRRQFAAAIALRLTPHYFPSLFFQCYLCSVWQKRAGFNRRVRVQEEEGKDTGQIGSTVVFSQCPQRIPRHEAIWTLNPPAVCQKLTLGVDCCLVWRLGKHRSQQ